MRQSIIGVLIFFKAICGFAQQTVHKHWDARFGGIDDDVIQKMCTTLDGNFILAGTSDSGADGDKTQVSRGGLDYWIVKIDSTGRYIWDKRFGGSGDELFSDICVTRDGGCLIGGLSYSPANGDKSQPSQGSDDFWVVKVDAQGNKQWDKRYGGTAADYLYTLNQTKDGGYILGGASFSGIGGDKTENNRGAAGFNSDYWIVKIDSLGNKQWDRRFGSSDREACVSAIQTFDGGYLLGGSSYDNDTSWDKTMRNFQPSLLSTPNFWIVKVDASGTKEWDRVFGGQFGEYYGNSLIMPNGHYLLGGTANDGISGNKTSNIPGYWLIEIDTAGNKINDWSYGVGTTHTGHGGAYPQFYSMIADQESGYLITGYVGDWTGGDKSEDNLSAQQVWTIKVDSQMHRVWDKTTFTSYTKIIYDESAGILDAGHGCYVVGVHTTAGIGGDKSQPNWESHDSLGDYWVVEYCDTVYTAIEEISRDIRLSIFPNPTSSEVSIHLENTDERSASFVLRDLTGRIIYHSDDNNLASSYTKILELGNFPSGNYFVEVELEHNRISHKIVKE